MILDDLLDDYVDWRESARAVADAYARWSFTSRAERALRFAAYTAARPRAEDRRGICRGGDGRPAVAAALALSPTTVSVWDSATATRAPALANAIAALTGTRIRELPVSKTIKIY
jgi:hypothetical protein